MRIPKHVDHLELGHSSNETSKLVAFQRIRVQEFGKKSDIPGDLGVRCDLRTLAMEAARRGPRTARDLPVTPTARL